MNLTTSQTSAVESTARDTLVIAGAGAGKTATMVARIVHLLTKRGASASEILALTFTRKAAAEVRERVENAAAAHWGKAAGSQTQGLTIGTFHSVALSFLRTDGHVLGYNGETMSVLDPFDAQLLLEQVADELGYRKKGKWLKGLSTKQLYKALEIEYTTANGKVGPAVLMAALDPGNPARKIIDGYWSRLFSMNALDFGLILRECRRMFTEHPEILARYRARYRYVLVDEAQDQNEVDWEMIDMIRGGAELFVVGDTRQAIFEFRGSQPRILTERAAKHANA